MEQSNLCFIGAGFHATTNIYPSAIEAGVKIEAIATRSKDNSRDALLKFGSTGGAYDDYSLMLKEVDCKGVIIVAQPRDQYKIALDCVRMGKHVYVDKPLGWNEEEAKLLADEADRHKVIAMVGFMKRYAPSYKKLKQTIEDKTLGLPKSFNLKFCVDGTPFCKNEEDYVKLAAIHIVDLVRYLFGEVSDIAGFKNNYGANVNQCITMKFENGCVGTIYLTSMEPWSRESENITVTFDNGFVQVEEVHKVIMHKNRTDSEQPFASQTEEDIVYTPSMTPMSGTLRDIYLRGFVGEIKHFIECVTYNKQPSSNSRDNVRTMKLCDDIIRALK